MSFSIVDARIDGAGGAPLTEGFSFESDDARLLISGMPREIGEALAGLRPVATGSVFFDGRSTRDLFLSGLSRFVARDPTYPEARTVEAFVTFARELSPLETKPTTDESLARFALGPSRREPLGRLARPILRLVSLAVAFASGAKLLVLEDPSAPWPLAADSVRRGASAFGFFAPRPRVEVPFSEAHAEALASAVDGGFEGRRLVVLTSSEATPLARRGFAHARFVGGRLVRSPSADKTAPLGHLVSVARNIEALEARLGDAVRRESLHRLVISPSVSPREIFAHALAVDALVAELTPLDTLAPTSPQEATPREATP